MMVNVNRELEDLLGVQQALMDIPNLILMQLDTYKDDLALETLPPLVAESHAILSMSTYLLVKLKVFCLGISAPSSFFNRFGGGVGDGSRV